MISWRFSPLTLVLVLAACPVPGDGKPGDTADTGDTAWCCVTDADDGDGYTPPEGDCDDSNPDVNPAAEEICDGNDNDCDGQIDEEGKTAYYADADGDGFGDPSSSVLECEPPPGYVANADDCDDRDSGVFPGNYELCDGLDQDCDGAIDEGLALLTLHPDADGDGYGDPYVTEASCVAVSGWVTDGNDCDDTSSDVNPDAVEVCDGVDDDCDGLVDEDGVCG